MSDRSVSAILKRPLWDQLRTKEKESREKDITIHHYFIAFSLTFMVNLWISQHHANNPIRFVICLIHITVSRQVKSTVCQCKNNLQHSWTFQRFSHWPVTVPPGGWFWYYSYICWPNITHINAQWARLHLHPHFLFYFMFFFGQIPTKVVRFMNVIWQWIIREIRKNTKT